MSSPNPILSIHDVLLQDVNEKHAAFEQAWVSYVEAVRRLQESNSWRQYAKTWEEYCANYLQYAASTLREYRASAVIAEISASVTKGDVQLPKEQARTLKKRLHAICQDASLIPQTIGLAYERTKSPIPTEGEIQAIYSVLEREKQERVVTLNGVDYDTRDDAIREEIAVALEELGERKLMHIETNSKVSHKRADLPQILALQLIMDYSAAKPSSNLYDFILGAKERKP